MTEHEHMPPINTPYTARWLSDGKLIGYLPGREEVMDYDNALKFALSIVDVLMFDKRVAGVK